MSDEQEKLAKDDTSSASAMSAAEALAAGVEGRRAAKFTFPGDDVSKGGANKGDANSKRVYSGNTLGTSKTTKKPNQKLGMLFAFLFAIVAAIVLAMFIALVLVLV